MNQKLANWLYVILIVSLIAFMIWIVFWLQGSGEECLIEPIKYYESKTRMICSCFENFGG